MTAQRAQASFNPLLLLTHKTNMESHHTERVTQNLWGLAGGGGWGGGVVHRGLFLLSLSQKRQTLLHRVAELSWRPAVNTQLTMATQLQAPRVGRGDPPTDSPDYSLIIWVSSSGLQECRLMTTVLKLFGFIYSSVSDLLFGGFFPAQRDSWVHQSNFRHGYIFDLSVWWAQG